MAGPQTVKQGTERRKHIFLFIKAYIKDHGYGPSIEDITKNSPISQTAVRYHLDRLVAQGLITVEPGKYRSIRVPDARRVPV